MYSTTRLFLTSLQKRRDSAQAAWLPRPPAKDQKGINQNQHEVKEDRENINSGLGLEQDRYKKIIP